MTRGWTIWFPQDTGVFLLARAPTLTLWPNQPSALWIREVTLTLAAYHHSTYSLHPPHVPMALHDLNTTWIPVHEIHCLPSNSGRWIKVVLPSPTTGPDLWPINTFKRLTVHMAIWDRDRPGPGQGHCSTYRPTSGSFQVGYTDSAQSWNLPSVIGKLRLSKFSSIAIQLLVGFPCCHVHSAQLTSTNEHHLGQCFSTFVRPRPGKSFFHKTRARSQQIYSSVPFQF